MSWAQRTLSVVPDIDPISAVVVRVSLPDALERLRRRHVSGAAQGVPAHVTLLVPFMPAGLLATSVRGVLGEIARQSEPFEVCFAGVGRFPGIVYLEPEPAAPFAALTTAIAERFPDFQPYGGKYRVVIPHLTVAEGDDRSLGRRVAEAAASPAFTRPVDAIEVLAQRPDGRWHQRWRIPIGFRP